MELETRAHTEGAQVPAKALRLGKLSKLSAWSINFFEQFCSKDNPNCTCTFDEDGDLELINRMCPQSGHTDRQDLFPQILWSDFLP